MVITRVNFEKEESTMTKCFSCKKDLNDTPCSLIYCHGHIVAYYCDECFKINVPSELSDKLNDIIVEKENRIPNKNSIFDQYYPDSGMPISGSYNPDKDAWIKSDEEKFTNKIQKWYDNNFNNDFKKTGTTK